MGNYWVEFLSLATVHFLAVIIPGPDFAVTVSQSVHFGRRVGVLTAIGIGTGISVHVLYTLIGVGALVHSNEYVFNAARLLGASYIFYLGVSLLRTHQQVHMTSVDKTSSSTASTWSALIKGFLTNALNPKATLFFLSIFTTIVSAETPMYLQVSYGLWMCIVNALWFILVALVFSRDTTRDYLIKFRHWFERCMGLILIGFSLKLFIEL
jgi:RhtB (resistance to homoserine/threonine) family protein